MKTFLALLVLALIAPASSLAKPRATVKTCKAVTLRGDQVYRLRAIGYAVPIRQVGTGRVLRWQRLTISCKEARTVIRKWLKQGFNELSPGVMYHGNSWGCDTDGDGNLIGPIACSGGLYGRITGVLRDVGDNS